MASGIYFAVITDNNQQVLLNKKIIINNISNNE
jgi:hypothetical protein